MTHRRHAGLVLLVLGLILSGCTTYSAISIDRVELGDEVRVRTVDGRELLFEVTFVGDRVLGGGGVTVPVERIDELELHHDSLARTIILGLLGTKETRFYILCGLIFVIVVLVA